jgi:hypothetical protein
MGMQNLGVATLAGALAIGSAPQSQDLANPFSGMATPGVVDRSEIYRQQSEQPATAPANPSEPALTFHPGLTSQADIVARFEPVKPGDKPELTPIKPTFHRVNLPDGGFYQSGTFEGKAGNELEMYLKAKGENDKCSIIIKDPKGNVIGTQVISTNQDGYVHTTLKLPEDGKFTIEIKSGDVTAQKLNPAIHPGDNLVARPVIATVIVGSKPDKVQSK